MPLYWKGRSGRFSDDYVVARLGSLVLNAACFDGDNQPYRIEIETKTQAFGKMVPQRQTVFSMDPFFGGLKHAKERAEYIARCLHYGLPIEWTENEQKHGEFTPLTGMLQSPPKTQIRDIWIRGIYFLPSSQTYFRVEYVANIDHVQGLNNKRIHIGGPSVVLKEIHTDHVFVASIDEFAKLGFKHHEGIDHHAEKLVRKTQG